MGNCHDLYCEHKGMKYVCFHTVHKRATDNQMAVTFHRSMRAIKRAISTLQSDQYGSLYLNSVLVGIISAESKLWQHNSFCVSGTVEILEVNSSI